MTNLPECIQKYILTWFTHHHAVAYLLLNREGIVDGLGGALTELGVSDIECGLAAEERCPFLIGLLPLKDPVVVIPLFKTTTQRMVDIHVFQTDTGYSVLLVDQTEYGCRLTEMQQKANELSLRLESSGSSPVGGKCKKVKPME